MPSRGLTQETAAVGTPATPILEPQRERAKSRASASQQELDAAKLAELRTLGERFAQPAKGPQTAVTA